MYLTHFGLTEPPFGMTPNPSFFFAGNNRGEILDALTYAVMHGEGIVKVTGEVGSGKTMLCRMLESQLPEHVEVIYLVNPTLTREQVIYAIAGELELPTSGKRVDEVIRMLHSDLIAKHISGKQVVLLIEEAQAMPLDTLEEIRLFSNLETSHHKLMQIVLFGQPELDENLSLPRMRQLRERITHSFKVPPMVPAVIPEYLMFRLRTAGYRGPDIFTQGAIKLISKVSEGIVRRISILADKSMLAAFANNAYAIKPKHVRAAIADSEFPKTALRMMNVKMAMAACASVLLVAAGIGWYFKANASNYVAPMPAAARQNTPHATEPSAQSPQAATQPNQALPAPAPATNLAPLPSSPPVETATAHDNAGKPASASTVNPVAQVPETNATLQQQLQISSAWLNDQAPDHYSLQIHMISSGDQAQVERFLHKVETETGLGEIHVYAARNATGVRYGIVFGSYATRAEALAKLAQLSGQLGYRPQLRTIGGIRREVATSLG